MTEPAGGLMRTVLSKSEFLVQNVKVILFLW